MPETPMEESLEPLVTVLTEISLTLDRIARSVELIAETLIAQSET